MPKKKGGRAPEEVKPAAPPGPARVAIVAMGSSNGAYLALAGALGGWDQLADEIWTINATANLIYHHRAFIMDDVKHILAEQASRTGKNERKVAQGIMRWLKDHPGPVYTTTAYPEWPALVEYPIDDVLRAVGTPYITNSVAYAVAFALAMHAKNPEVCKELSLFGCDFNYPGSPAFEPGRGSVEFLLGMACARGIEVNLPDTTTLLDGNVPMEKKLYGFHGPVRPVNENGQIRLKRGAECTSTGTT